MNSARWFIRREDDEPPRTPPESPFRRFTACCLKCQSYDLRITGVYDEGVGEARLVVQCGRCRQIESVPLR